MTPSPSSKSLNLRYKPLSEELLKSPAHQKVEKLWIGPRLSQHMSPSLVVQSLPSSLQHLDWDMTDSATPILDGVLRQLLQTPSLRHLCLRFRGDDYAVMLSKHLANATLESLDLRGNHISDIGAQALASSLSSKSSSLVCLNLGYNRIGNDGIQALSQALRSSNNDKLQRINLSCNVFGQEGANALAHMLETNVSLKELSLFCNHIPHASCVQLAHSLQNYNYTLQHLKLGGTLTDTFCDIRLEIEFLLKLNRNGRDKLRAAQVGLDEWWNDVILSNHDEEDVDVLLYFLSNKPELLCTGQ